MEPAKRRYTLEEFEKEVGGRRAELIDGEIVMMAPASPQHSITQGNLLNILSRDMAKEGNVPAQPKVDDPRYWKFIIEAWTYYAPRTALVHDIAAFQASKFELPQKGPIRSKPIWVCEILSPSNWSHDTNTKRFILEQHNVPYYWIVDPLRRGIYVYHLKRSGEHYQLLQAPDVDSGIVQLMPFEAIHINMKEIFT